MANGSATTKTNLNLRSGPGTSSSVIWTIPGQTQVTLTGVPNNGWYPVTVNDKTGFVSGEYLKGITEYTSGTPATPSTPAAGPSTNPFYNPTSQYGSSQNWYDTPIVKQSAGMDAEFEKFITDQGFGGLNRKGDFARGLGDRVKSGYAAAQLNNPALTNREYLSGLGSDFLAKARAAATPQQRGEQWGIAAPRARWTSR